jgi:hypothetical protein
MLRPMALGFGLFAVAFVACGGSTEGGGGGGSGSAPARQALDATAFCNRLIDECKDNSATHAECEKRFSEVRVSPDCVNKFATTVCFDIVKPGGLCFPSCSGTSRTCNGDATVTTCTTDGRLVTFDCATVCRGLGAKYSGICSETYIAQTSEDGLPRCWCE